jgi:hypothetical protein
LLDQKQLMMLVRKAIIKLPLLRKLTLEVPVILCNWQIQDDGEYTADLEYLLKNVNRITGVLHQWVEAQNPFHVAVFWDTGNNGTLTWTTGRHWRSIKWRIAIGFNAKLYLPHMLHMMYYWEESRVHFLGLNPRRLLHICRDRSCKCYRFILLRVTTFDPKARFHLGPSFKEYAQEENQPEPVGDYSVPNKFSHGGLGRVLRMTSVELF